MFESKTCQDIKKLQEKVFVLEQFLEKMKSDLLEMCPYIKNPTRKEEMDFEEIIREKGIPTVYDYQRYQAKKFSKRLLHQFQELENELPQYQNLIDYTERFTLVPGFQEYQDRITEDSLEVHELVKECWRKHSRISIAYQTIKRIHDYFYEGIDWDKDEFFSKMMKEYIEQGTSEDALIWATNQMDFKILVNQDLKMNVNF